MCQAAGLPGAPALIRVRQSASSKPHTHPGSAPRTARGAPSVPHCPSQRGTVRLGPGPPPKAAPSQGAPEELHGRVWEDALSGKPLVSPGSCTPRVGCGVPWYPAGLGQTGSAQPAQPQGLCTAEMCAACQHAVPGGPHCATPTGTCPPQLCQLPPHSPTRDRHTQRSRMDGQEPFGAPWREMLSCSGGDHTPQGSACSPPGWSA